MIITAHPQGQTNQLDSIRYSPGIVPSMDHLMMGSESELLALKQQSAPAAYMICISDADNLKALLNCIIDCGTQKRTGEKGQTIELSRYVLNREEKIPLARGYCALCREALRPAE